MENPEFGKRAKATERQTATVSENAGNADNKEGRISCAHDGCPFALEFDAKPIHGAQAVGADGGAKDTVFIEDADVFIKKLHPSPRLVVELPMCDAGYRQFTFETAVLS